MNYAAMFTHRKDGLYMGYWRDADGKRHAVYDRDPRRLYDKLQEREAAGKEPMTFRRAADGWEVEHVEKLVRSTQSTYRAQIDFLREYFGDTPVKDITAADVSALLLFEKEKGYSFKHAAAKKSILKQILDYAIINNEITVNPTASVRVPRGMKKGHIEAPEESEVSVIVENLNKPYGDFVAMLLYTGMRTEEAAALTWGDIEENEICVRRAVDLHGTPIIKEAKTEAGERRVPILDKHRPFLARPKNATDTDYIFNENGKLLTRGQISRRWLAWCKAAGLAEQRVYEHRHRGKKECTRVEWRPTITPHQLRHNYATVLFEQDVDELTAKDVMGHEDIQTTRQIYTSLRKKHREQEIKKINNGF